MNERKIGWIEGYRYSLFHRNGIIGNGIWGDGNYVYTVGYTSPDYYYNEDSYLCLIKWDSNGNQIWNRTMGDQIRVENGIWGYGTNVYIVGQENASLLLMDWDENGTLLWNRYVGGCGLRI